MKWNSYQEASAEALRLQIDDATNKDLHQEEDEEEREEVKEIKTKKRRKK